MQIDSERFAFIPRRLHGFATTGNAYDACQTDEGIAQGDTLVILAEGAIGLAWAWPVAVTQAAGNLHRAKEDPVATIEGIAADFGMEVEAIHYAVEIARAMHLKLDPLFEQICPAA